MAQALSILPQCVQPAAIQGIAFVGCRQSLECACHSFVFLHFLQLSILTSSCNPMDLQIALDAARQYCSSVNPSLKDSKATLLQIIVTICMTLALLAVILRFWSRKIANVRIGRDDWLIVLALIFALAVDVLIFVSIADGGGRHSFMIDPGNMTLQTNLAAAWMLTTTLTLARLSIIALYLRIFSTLRTFRKVLHATAGFVIIIMLACTLLYTFSCRPVSYYWDKKIPGGRCLDQKKLLAAECGVSGVTGFWVLVLPIPAIRRLQTSFRRKAILIGLFALGAFVCVTSLIRIEFIVGIDANDQHWSMVPFSIWIALEVNVGIVAVCLPTFMPLFKAWRPKLFSSIRSVSSIRSRSGQPSHATLDDEARIYVGGDQKSANTAGVKITELEDGTRQESVDGEGSEVWPMSVFEVAKEVDTERDAILSSKQRVEQT